MNANEDVLWPEHNPPLSNFYAYKNTFDENAVWLDVPKQRDCLPLRLPPESKLINSPVSFLNTSNPYLDVTTPEFDGHLIRDSPLETLPEPPLPGLEAAALHSPAETDTFLQPSYEQEPSPIFPLAMMSSSDDWNLLLSPASVATSSMGPSLVSPAIEQTPSSSNGTAASQGYTQSLQQQSEAESEHMVAFLSRHFSESPGQWYVK